MTPRWSCETCAQAQACMTQVRNRGPFARAVCEGARKAVTYRQRTNTGTLIIDYMARNDQATAARLAAELGIPRTSAMYHLSRLYRDGVLTYEEDHRTQTYIFRRIQC